MALTVRLLVHAAALIAGLAVGATVGSASNIWTCSGSTAWHWPNPNDVWYYNSAPNTPRPYQSIWDNEIGEWNAGTCVDTSRVYVSSDADVKVMANFYGQTDWVGLTVPVDYDGSSCHWILVKGQINRTYTDYAPYTEGDIHRISCHEFGHVLGLAHTTATSSCIGPGTSESGDAHDKSLVDSIHAHHGC